MHRRALEAHQAHDRGARGGVLVGDVGVPDAARGCAGNRPVVPASNSGDDGGKGTDIELVCY